ncbi:MAG: DUF4976 domain-containing protein [Chitinophagaceae bacterium]|nr:DUF4976 domain-containing protein [Chitinophagaceae bacterium]
MQGINLTPHITREEKNIDRKTLYYHFYEYGADHTVLPHLGVRDERYKLIYFYTVNEWELYDLKKDPAEQNNLMKSEKYQKLFLKMKKELIALRNHYNDYEQAGELQ